MKTKAGWWLLVAVVTVTACGSDVVSSTTDPPDSTPETTVTTAARIEATTTTSTRPPATATSTGATTTSGTVPSTNEAPSTTNAPPTTDAPPITIRLNVDRAVDDDATRGFAATVEAVLKDPRGWEQAGFVFSFEPPGADYTIVLAEGPDVDALCAPYTTRSRFSCQIGPVVALNADRWRYAVDDWPGSLLEYQTMLVNHEVGHLLGQHHPAEFCGGAGDPAAVMAQQSSGVGDCVANPWPLPWEIACAARHDEPLAPPYEADATPICGPDG